MANSRTTAKNEGTGTADGHDERRPSKATSPPQQTLTELRERVADLLRELEDERQQRHLLIAALHNLSSFLSRQRGLPPQDAKSVVAADSEVSARGADFDASFSPRAMARACAITDNGIRGLVAATIIEEDDRIRMGFGEDAKLGAGGFGWDPAKKRNAFNPIREGLEKRGCHFGATADDFMGLETVGDMVKLVKSSAY